MTGMPRRAAFTSAGRWAAVVVVGTVVVTGGLWLVWPGGDFTTEPPAVTRAAPVDAQPADVEPADVEPVTSMAARPACDTVDRAFDPRTITVPGATRGADVVSPPRDAAGVPGTPPLSDYGKTVFAWDRSVRPGDPVGNVLLNAHTWPDGSALGNRLLAELDRGDRIVVHGARSELCYRVTERVEVLAADGLPRYYETDGPPQLAIVVCSGRRLGPGEWEKRTVWFASPAA